ncbi:transposase domain-containing protein [Paraburkholderia aromaticivorans]|uniref:transposase domain-containing protein n=1 Tax=Paraburkholderia aromaticivorans TaxID=2026199 RepID=UPI001F0D183F|nr:transposase domain-containing protein [Paraburkholderia aromaticivorans]
MHSCVRYPESVTLPNKAHQIDPYRYLIWLFTKLALAKTVDDYDALLPLEDACRTPLIPVANKIWRAPGRHSEGRR